MREHARAQVQRANTLGGRSASRACNRGHYRRPDGAARRASDERRSQRPLSQRAHAHARPHSHATLPLPAAAAGRSLRLPRSRGRDGPCGGWTRSPAVSDCTRAQARARDGRRAAGGARAGPTRGTRTRRPHCGCRRADLVHGLERRAHMSPGPGPYGCVATMDEDHDHETVFFFGVASSCVF